MRRSNVYNNIYQLQLHAIHENWIYTIDGSLGKYDSFFRRTKYLSHDHSNSEHAKSNHYLFDLPKKKKKKPVIYSIKRVKHE